jgi:hypothetical protein
MQNNPQIDFSNEIIKASLKNFAYDGQCEGSRGSYLFGLIQLSVKQDKIRTAILNELAVEQDDTWTLIQLFDLAKLFALKGDKEAIEAIYARFLNHPIEGSDWAGSSDILELDGLEGLKFIAEKFGKVIENNPEEWQNGSIIQHFQEKNPQVDARLELEAASKDNRFIKIYLDNIKQTGKNWEDHKRGTIHYKDILDEILNSRINFRFFRKKLNDAELRMLANQFLVEKRSKNRAKLLSVFTKNKFPLDSEIILNLAKRNPKSKITGIAINALEFLKSDSVRQFAIEKITLSKRPERFTHIIISNYNTGDETLLTKIVENTKNEVTLESLIHDYRKIYKENPTPDCRLPLEALYNKHNCALCRKDLINILIENDVLSEKIKSEIPFDCNEETRTLLTQ